MMKTLLLANTSKKGNNMKKLIITIETYIDDKNVDKYLENCENLIVETIRNADLSKKVVNDWGDTIYIEIMEGGK